MKCRLAAAKTEAGKTNRHHSGIVVMTQEAWRSRSASDYASPFISAMYLTPVDIAVGVKRLDRDHTEDNFAVDIYEGLDQDFDWDYNTC